MDLFSTENFSLEEKLNNQKNNITQLTETYQQSDSVSNPSDIIQIVKGKKMVNTIKRKDQEISDFGEEITGAKKDAWKLRGLNLNDLAVLTEAEKDKLIERKNILRLDANYLMQEKNVPQEVAIAAEIILKKIAPKPNIHYSLSSSLSKKQKSYENYISTLKDIQNYIENCDTLADVEGLSKYFEEKYFIKLQNSLSRINTSLSEMKNTHTKEEGIALIMRNCSTPNNKIYNHVMENQNKYNSIGDIINDLSEHFKLHQAFALSTQSSRHYISFTLDFKDKKEISHKLSINYPNVSDENMWKTRICITPVKYMNDDKEKFRLVDAKKFSPFNSARFETIELAEAAAKQFYADNFEKLTKKVSAKPKLEPPKREIFDALPQANSYTEEQLLKTFKLRGGQFGNYQDNRQIILDNTFVAFDRLAKTMNVSPEFISLGNSLAIAFGARGVPGALAHYESSQTVINLTKLGGAGSLAHEWGHALDHILGESLLKKDQVLTKADGIYLTDLARHSNKKEANPITQKLVSITSDLIELFKYKGVDANGMNILTKFYKDSRVFDSGKTKLYWTSNKEMFARAFETYIYDKMQIAKDPCNYLVSGVSEKSCLAGQDIEKATSVYPIGEERKIIHEKLDELIKVISEHQIELMSPIVEINKERKAEIAAKKAIIKSNKDDLEIS